MTILINQISEQLRDMNYSIILLQRKLPNKTKKIMDYFVEFSIQLD